MKNNKFFTPIIVFVFVLVIAGIAYPYLLTGLGYLFFKENTIGSPIIINGTIIGSYLIAGKINNSALFWPNYNNSFEFGYDPYITVNQALSQVDRISNYTGIPKSYLIKIIYENSNQIEREDIYIFSSGQRVVNVMQLNYILIKSFPKIYSDEK
ncbi:MAG: potassium-transporting ATPase subunit C [Caldisphaera sp.]|jgi:K+-transporting ATPase ATPase C chain|nr:potassium-transporting ATPase subunit C [Caldisphaera sp.]PMP60438.1 MAG: hypothetical protein C0201_02915 [Caldisphaera sp.]PMP87809.1 MAG: hypothetical protein C0172_04175 [Caldisphaera sp.]